MTKITRTIFLTPGLVELGESSRQIHYQIAQKLIDKQIDLVILIDTSSSRFIAEYFAKVAKDLENDSLKTENSTSGLAALNLAESITHKDLAEKVVSNEAKIQKIPEVLTFKTAVLAHLSLPGILKPGDAILFQNDWTDNYL